jgi:hypothetical protein
MEIYIFLKDNGLGQALVEIADFPQPQASSSNRTTGTSDVSFVKLMSPFAYVNNQLIKYVPTTVTLGEYLQPDLHTAILWTIISVSAMRPK